MQHATPPKLGRFRIPRSVQRQIIRREITILELARVLELSYASAWFRYYGRARWHPRDTARFAKNLGINPRELPGDGCRCDGALVFCDRCANLLLDARAARGLHVAESADERRARLVTESRRAAVDLALELEREALETYRGDEHGDERADYRADRRAVDHPCRPVVHGVALQA